MNVIVQNDSRNAPAALASPVNSHNEWDPLEEIIVGRLEGAVMPSGHPVVTSVIPGFTARLMPLVGGFRYPGFMVAKAQAELDGFVALLTSLGVAVLTRHYGFTSCFAAGPVWTSSSAACAEPAGGTANEGTR
jgi:glycine amidinotransferase